MTNAEALRLRPGDKISQRPQPGSPRPASFTIARVSLSGEGLIIVTTTGLHFSAVGSRARQAGEEMTSKYDRLADHLAASGAETITLTFAEIEAVVGPLPAAARSLMAWWGATANGRYYNSYAMHWQDAGYIADRLDFAAQTVTFRRLAH